MSVEWRNGDVALLNHQSGGTLPVIPTQLLCKNDENPGPGEVVKLKDDLFCIQESYFQPVLDSGKSSSKRKRKSTGCDEDPAERRHQQVLRYLEHDLAFLQSSPAPCEYFSRHADQAQHAKVIIGSDEIKKLGVGDQLKQLSALASQCLPGQPVQYENDEEIDSSAPSLVLDVDVDHSAGMRDCLFNTHVQHRCDRACLVDIKLGKFILPAHSSFVMSDVSSIDTLLSTGSQYDVIVMDPPWENKSAARSHRYSTLPVGDIGKLPVSDLAAKHALVVIWITNKPKLIETVIKTVLPKWKLHYLTEWHWLKVTSTGEPVIPFASTHKRSYETLLLCRRCCTEQVRRCAKSCCIGVTTTAAEAVAATAVTSCDAAACPDAKRCRQDVSTAPGRTTGGNASNLAQAVHVSRSDVCREGTDVTPSTLEPAHTDDLCKTAGSVATGIQTNSTPSPVSVEMPVSEQIHTSVSSSGDPCTKSLDCVDFQGVEARECPSALAHSPSSSSSDEQQRITLTSHVESRCTDSCGEINNTTMDVDAETSHCKQLPSHLTLVSIPSRVHSHKPPLSDILQPYIPRDVRCLELFSRTLTSGWTSWGNEVLALQHVDFYQRSPPCE
ncbi:uncharacterized protein LOC135816069 [Sycon ciliatum]|uniref:uncharacterized protein LOC135816069 n=1 Tax=Sycon ciliatum TaxID=27933 RepID=UPI0020ACA113|eukprot:scpid36631/ scgid34973/ Methyltransferase-like protein 4